MLPSRVTLSYIISKPWSQVSFSFSPPVHTFILSPIEFSVPFVQLPLYVITGVAGGLVVSRVAIEVEVVGSSPASDSFLSYKLTGRKCESVELAKSDANRRAYRKAKKWENAQPSAR